jgi:hypothetical protein
VSQIGGDFKEKLGTFESGVAASLELTYGN